MTDSKTLNEVKINIFKARIADFQRLMEMDPASREDQQHLLKFCDAVVEGGIVQYLAYPEILSEIAGKIKAELSEHHHFIAEAMYFAKITNPFRIISGMTGSEQ